MATVFPTKTPVFQLPRHRHSRRRALFSSISSLAPPLPRRFAVLKTGHALEYTQRTYGGYANMLRNLLAEDHSDENWDTFSVIDGDFSFLQRPHLYDGYVLTGSAADAHADDDWILRLCDALRMLHADGKRLLGICFGHQVLARALGGKTGRADVGWELGIKRLDVDSQAVMKLYGFDLVSDLYAIESHRDQVLQVPPGAMVLASSEKTNIEMFALGHTVLAIQCHPEFTKDVVIDIIQNRLSKQIISEEVAAEAIRSLEDKEANQESLKQLCKTFLRKTQ